MSSESKLREAARADQDEAGARADPIGLENEEGARLGRVGSDIS